MSRRKLLTAIKRGVYANAGRIDGDSSQQEPTAPLLPEFPQPPLPLHPPSLNPPPINDPSAPQAPSTED